MKNFEPLNLNSILSAEPALHLLFWVVYFFYPVLKYGDHSNYQFSLPTSLTSLLLGCILAYIFYFFLLPRKDSIPGFVIITVISVFLTSLIYCLIIHQTTNCDCNLRVCVLNHIFHFGSILLVFFTVFFIKQTYHKERNLQSIKREKIETDLKGLRAQIHPHFLFNTLNTIYSHALNQEKIVSTLILKLSDNMKYMLYEGQKDKVPLKDEVNHILGYIDLQKARLENKIEVKINDTIEDRERLIAPLILICFVENCFKYTSIIPGEGHSIDIQIGLTGNEFYFRCSNPFDPKSNLQADASWTESGIGLRNVKKRLELIYPKSHSFNYLSKENVFVVELKIIL